MRDVVILANPNPVSFSHAIADRVVETLRRRGHEVTVLDLCADGFTVAMSAEERAAYHGEQPVLDPMVGRHISTITSADTLIFIYPTWWSSVPAILKGWLERVMVPGVGFVFDEAHKVRPGLTNIRRIVGISSYGSPRWLVKVTNDNGRRTIMRALRVSTGLRTRTSWLGLYHSDRATPDDRTQFLDECERLAAKL